MVGWLFVPIKALAPTGCGNNAFYRLDEGTKSSWSKVINQYQRRADLTPNLAATVRARRGTGATAAGAPGLPCLVMAGGGLGAVCGGDAAVEPFLPRSVSGTCSRIWTPFVKLAFSWRPECLSRY